jgi:hypothetical protein
MTSYFKRPKLPLSVKELGLTSSTYGVSEQSVSIPVPSVINELPTKIQYLKSILDNGIWDSFVSHLNILVQQKLDLLTFYGIPQVHYIDLLLVCKLILFLFLMLCIIYVDII